MGRLTRYKGRIKGDKRTVEFDFKEKRKAYTDVYNYLIRLSDTEEFWKMLESDEDSIEEYGELLEGIHLRLDGLVFEITRNSSNLKDMELVDKHVRANWYSNKGLREIIIKQLKFISKNTYFKMYNEEEEVLEPLCMEEVENV